MMKTAFAACLLLAPCPAALAMEWEGMDNGGYFSVRGGVSHLADQDFDTLAGTVTTKAKASWVGTAAIGVRISPHLRAEVEGGYQTNELDEAHIPGHGPGTGTKPASGDVSIRSGMANLYYDMFQKTRLSPYVGAGVGMANVKYRETCVNGVPFTADDDDTVLAGQAMVGVRYRFNPDVAGTAEYRYFRTADVKVNGAGGGTADVETASHNAMVGLELKF